MFNLLIINILGYDKIPTICRLRLYKQLNEDSKILKFHRENNDILNDKNNELSDINNRIETLELQNSYLQKIKQVLNKQLLNSYIENLIITFLLIYICSFIRQISRSYSYESFSRLDFSLLLLFDINIYKDFFYVKKYFFCLFLFMSINLIYYFCLNYKDYKNLEKLSQKLKVLFLIYTLILLTIIVVIIRDEKEKRLEYINQLNGYIDKINYQQKNFKTNEVISSFTTDFWEDLDLPKYLRPGIFFMIDTFNKSKYKISQIIDIIPEIIKIIDNDIFVISDKISEEELKYKIFQAIDPKEDYEKQLILLKKIKHQINNLISKKSIFTRYSAYLPDITNGKNIFIFCILLCIIALFFWLIFSIYLHIFTYNRKVLNYSVSIALILNIIFIIKLISGKNFIPTLEKKKLNI